MKKSRGKLHNIKLCHKILKELATMQKIHKKLIKRKRLFKCGKTDSFEENGVLHEFHEAIRIYKKLKCMNVYGNSPNLEQSSIIYDGWHQDDSNVIRLLFKTLSTIE